MSIDKSLFDWETTKFYYLATPFSKYPKGNKAAFEEASRQAAILTNAGVPIFCPIAHSWSIGSTGILDARDYKTMIQLDMPFLNLCAGLIVCKMLGWRESEGVELEYMHMFQQNKPIIWMDPDFVPIELLS